MSSTGLSLILCLQGTQAYNHTTTDIAPYLRRVRLDEVYRVISEVNRSLGLNGAPDSGLEWVADIPLPMWIILASCIVISLCFYVARILYGDASILARSRVALRRKHSSAVV